MSAEGNFHMASGRAAWLESALEALYRVSRVLSRTLELAAEVKNLINSTRVFRVLELEDLLPAAWHRTEQHANNRVEADHGRLKSRLRPMRDRGGRSTAVVPRSGPVR